MNTVFKKYYFISKLKEILRLPEMYVTADIYKSLSKSICMIILPLYLFLNCNVVAAQIEQRNFLSKEYNINGAAVSLDVAAWRKFRRQKITVDLASIPDAARNQILTAANELMTRPWEALKATDYLLFNSMGNRSIYEAQYFSRRKKLNKLIIAELIERKGKYMPEIINGLWLILEESTWALPAHMYLQKEGEGLPDPNEDVIDLFTGDTAVLLSWMIFLLKEELESISPMLIKRIEFELNKRIIIPYLNRNDFWWMGFQDPGRKMNNWNIWINTNVLLTTLLVVEDTARLRKIIEKNIRSADKFINSYPADGGCDEGPGYWGAAGGRLIEFIHLLTEVSSYKLDWSDNTIMQNIATYIYKAHIANKWFVNFADAPASLIPNPATIYTSSVIFKDQKLKQFASYLYQLSNSIQLGYGADDVNAFLNNLELHKQLQGVPARAPMIRSSWLPNLQVWFARQTAESEKGLFMAAKGGNNAESHNHNDLGSFIIYVNGLPALVDLGAARYTKETFTSDRYRLWVYNSDWHNCPSINGSRQKAGASYKVKNVSFASSQQESSLTMDLAYAYPKEAAINKWIRRLEFNSDKGIIKLKEDYDLKEYKEPFQLHFITAHPVQVINPGLLKIILSDGESALKIKFDENFLEPVINEQPNTNPGLTIWGKTIYQLSLRSKRNVLKGAHVIQFF